MSGAYFELTGPKLSSQVMNALYARYLDCVSVKSVRELHAEWDKCADPMDTNMYIPKYGMTMGQFMFFKLVSTPTTKPVTDVDDVHK